MSCELLSSLSVGDMTVRYSLAAIFLGRICLSGEITALRAVQRAIVDRAIAFYGRVAPILKDGISRRQGAIGAS